MTQHENDPNGFDGDETGAPASLAAILAPITPAQFFAEYHGRKPLHIPGTPEKFAAVMSWPKLRQVLQQAGNWTPAALQMARDSRMVPAADYCRAALSRDGAKDTLIPDPARVATLMEQGASLVLNDLDNLSPDLTAVADLAGALEEALASKVQANLYCSPRERQAFASHYDTHDVFAVHVEGEKLWRIYEGRVDNPVEHTVFKSQTRAQHETAKGRVAAEVLMRPGDLLYLPRGQYHDAVAQSDRTIHIAFGAVAVIGLDVISALFERAVHDPLFRADLPRHAAKSGDAGEAAFADHLRQLGERLAQLAAAPETIETLRKLQDGYRYRQPAPREPAGRRWRITAEDFAVVAQGSGWALTRGGKGTAIPPGFDRAVMWILSAKRFSDADLASAFPALSATDRKELLHALAAMKVIASA